LCFLLKLFSLHIPAATERQSQGNYILNGLGLVTKRGIDS